MEDFSSLAAGCRIVCSSDDYTGLALNGATIPIDLRVVRCTTITIGKFASIGTNTVVLPGVQIGEGAAVGAGCVVSKNLEPWGIYSGPRAEKIGKRHQSRIIEMAQSLK
jgi:galactoside O-acetyltransferase